MKGKMKLGLAPGASAKAIVPDGAAVMVAEAEGPITATLSTTRVAKARRREGPTCIELPACAIEMANGTAPARNGPFLRYWLVFAPRWSGQGRRKDRFNVGMLEGEARFEQRRRYDALTREDRSGYQFAAERDSQDARRNSQSSGAG